MKKYIIPAVEITAMRSEGVIATSFVINNDPDVVVGGSTEETDKSGGVGQLTSKYGWDSADWSE